MPFYVDTSNVLLDVNDRSDIDRLDEELFGNLKFLIFYKLFDSIYTYVEFVVLAIKLPSLFTAILLNYAFALLFYMLSSLSVVL